MTTLGIGMCSQDATYDWSDIKPVDHNGHCKLAVELLEQSAQKWDEAERLINHIEYEYNHLLIDDDAKRAKFGEAFALQDAAKELEQQAHIADFLDWQSQLREELEAAQERRMFEEQLRHGG